MSSYNELNFLNARKSEKQAEAAVNILYTWAQIWGTKLFSPGHTISQFKNQNSAPNLCSLVHAVLACPDVA